ncbi:Tab2/Atab2 family RNA-binding protein [Synechocystis sp. LKSZ1]|uniref:Tab2/Atab2 family RNA-binding protein n=1 Tax=Synechocystis sp. LKSZ1 TaxID=3144951 RepID=UPI00336C197F
MAIIWELDFYSRPLRDEEQKKVWEVLICEAPQTVSQDPATLFRYSQVCPSSTVNSLWLKQAIEAAIAESGQRPQKIRFFRRPMNNMISKACEEAGVTGVASRHTYALQLWLQERYQQFYPQQPGYEASLAQGASVQYPELNTAPLPDAVRGDRGDQWALVSLEAAAFEDMEDWEVGFGEAFSLKALGLAPETRIPGLILFSPRALPLAGWLSGLELGYLKFQEKPLPLMRLETGVSDSWSLVNLTNAATVAEAKGFEQAKAEAQQVHFLAIQSDPNSETFAGFWLLREMGESV